MCVNGIWFVCQVDRTVAALKRSNISVGEGVKSRTYIRVKTEADTNEGTSVGS